MTIHRNDGTKGIKTTPTIQPKQPKPSSNPGDGDDDAAIHCDDGDDDRTIERHDNVKDVNHHDEVTTPLKLARREGNRG